jgi:RNA polymerase sigma-70 factor (ECF subfamily)
LVASEQALLKRAKQLDETALTALYDRYAPRVYAYIYRRVSDAQLAENLTGDVFVRVLHAIQAERFWHTSFQAWLYRIAHNLVVDHYRQRPPAAPVSLEQAMTFSDGDDPADAVQENLDHERLWAAIGRLTPEQQHVLALRFGQGLTARETAQVVDKTTGAVEALQRRALAALRRILNGTDKA